MNYIFCCSISLPSQQLVAAATQGSSGSFNSPNYPSNYDASSNCGWYITGPTGHYITITFTNFAVIGDGRLLHWGLRQDS